MRICRNIPFVYSVAVIIIWRVCFRHAIGQFAERNLLYGPKFQRKCSFRSSKSPYLGKKVEIKLQDVCQPWGLGC